MTRSAHRRSDACASCAGNGIHLVIGETPVARRVCATLDCAGRVRHLVAPGDRELVMALRDGVVSAAILVRDDMAALRYALALAHLDKSIPLLVTIFDRTVADQLRRFLPQARVVSVAVLAVPSLAGPCMKSDVLASFLDADHLVEIRREGKELRERRSPRPSRKLRSRAASALKWDHRHHDAGTRCLLTGALGLTAILAGDIAWLALMERHSLGDSFLEAARVVASVGPGPTETGAFYGVASALAMLATVVFTAMFTAGVIDRLFEPRLLGLLGPMAAPRAGHVIVVGMGQLGVRLCMQLRDMNVSVIGVERDRSAPFLPLARQLGIPVFVGDGTERRVLEKLGLRRCRAVAAVGSDDLDNIAVAVVTAAISPTTRVVLRAGEHEAIAGTRSLLPLGVIRDTTEMAATFVNAFLMGRNMEGVVAGTDATYLRTSAGTLEESRLSSHQNCRHDRHAGSCAPMAREPLESGS